MKLLIIDDSTVNNIILQNLLEDMGYEAHTALNAEDASKIIKEVSPDLILMDLMMPDVSGFDLLKRFRKEQISIPVIIVSAFSDDEYKRKAKELGARDYLLKPVDKKILASCLEK